MKNNALKILLISLLFSGFTSCSSDDELDIPEKESTYTFQSIKWCLEEGDGCEELEKNVHNTFYNYEAEAVDITVNPLEKVKDYSYFHNNEDTELLKQLTGDSLMVSIPSEFSLLSTQYGYFLGKTAPLYIGKQVDLDPTFRTEKTTTLAPKTKMTEDHTIYQNKITATYIISFFSEDLGYKEIKGKWTGVFFKNLTGNTLFEEIK